MTPPPVLLQSRRDVTASPSPHRHRPTRNAFWIALVTCAVIGMALRAFNLFDAPIRTDEPTITLRAVAAARGDLVPSGFDYPPMAAYVLGILLRITALVDPDVLTSATAPYDIGRVLFTLLSGVGIVLTGLLGAAVARDERERWVFGIGAAGALAISFLSVRIGNHARPDQLQWILTVAALLATLTWDSRRTTKWLVAAGVCAGLAAATKYIGGVVVLTTLIAVLTAKGRVQRQRVQDGLLLGGVSLAGFILGTAGTVVTNTQSFMTGFLGELGHQGGLHLGYEPDGNAGWFHLTTSLPGNWGWPLTIATVVGTVLVARDGTRQQRLILSFAVAGSLFAVLSQVRFPHYVLLPLPVLAVLAFVAIDHLVRRHAAAAILVWAVVGVSMVVTIADDLRLGRALGAPDTRELAVQLQAPFADDLVVEAYTALGSEVAVSLYSLTDDPRLLDCACVVAISSYQEQRFRNRPDLYPDQIARYDLIRERGVVIGGVGPDRPLAYNWDLLPAWGLRNIPLTGDVGPVGPQIELLRLAGAP